jgi:transcriptional regulator with XRE-family HTH domain
MSMPERSFGRTVRYRRTKLGLSQAKLGELVGRSTATIKSWEKDKTRPSDPKVLSTLAAILGVSEYQLFDKTDVDRPVLEETSPTVEQALAELSREQPIVVPNSTPEPHAADTAAYTDDTETEPLEVGPAVAADLDDPESEVPIRQPEEAPSEKAPALVSMGASQPAYAAPPEPYVQAPITPSPEVSYIEDRSQRQMYRVRTLATIVALVALVVAFIWAFGEGLGALGDWWDSFFNNLRL